MFSALSWKNLERKKVFVKIRQVNYENNWGCMNIFIQSLIIFNDFEFFMHMDGLQSVNQSILRLAVMARSWKIIHENPCCYTF